MPLPHCPFRRLCSVLLLLLICWLPVRGQTSEAAPPPSAGPRRSASELETLVAPIALYPDPLIATLLPAAAYPVEIVQLARMLQSPDGSAQVRDQSWDPKVKELAAFPAVVETLNKDLGWTVDLGQAFVAQPQDVMDAIQALRKKAQALGNLQSIPQQVVIVTNSVVERTYQQQIVYVTNTVVEIQPASPQVIYVPTYNPTVVYTSPPPSPAQSLLTFGAGIAVGAIIANNCDWHYGGVYVGPWRPPYYYPPPPYYRPPPYHPPPGYRPPPPGYRPPGYPPPGTRPPAARPYDSGQMPARWQPDSGRLASAGAPSTLPAQESRGWGSGGPTASTQPAPARGTAGGGQGAARPTPQPAPSRPAAAAPTPRPSYPTGGAPAPRPAYPGSAGPEAVYPGAGTGAGNRMTSSTAFGSQGNSAYSAFSHGGSGNIQNYSNRGAASRGGFQGGARGGGGRGGRR